MGRIYNKYLFSKTKGNKYIFKTVCEDFSDCGSYYCKDEEKMRLCDDVDYNNYYYSNKDIAVHGTMDQFSLDDKNINTIKFCDFENCLLHYGCFCPDDSERDQYLYLLGDLNCKTLKIIEITYLGEEAANDFINNIKKFLELGSLYIHECEIKNKQLIKLFNYLSIIKSLFCIEINFNNALNLSKKNKNKISKLFPDIAFNENNEGSSINWINHRIDFSSK